MADPRMRAEQVQPGLVHLLYQKVRTGLKKDGQTHQKDTKASFQGLPLAKLGKSEVGAFFSIPEPEPEPRRRAWRG